MKKLVLFLLVGLLFVGCDEILKHTVTFEPNGGELSSTKAVTVENGKSVFRPKDPVREGYIFAGWFDKKSGGKEWNFVIDRVIEDKTLYAQWKATALILAASEH